ncbi:MAG: DUF6785 family protein [Armatimonadota bacterium]
MKQPFRLWPVLFIGSILAALNALWSVYLNQRWNQGGINLLSIYYTVVFSIVVIHSLNLGVRRLLPGLSLARSEILALFVMATIGTSVSFFAEYGAAMAVYPFRYAKQDITWSTQLIPDLSRAFVVSDPNAVQSFFLGQSSIRSWSALQPWLAPFLMWGLFVAAVVWIGVCMTGLTYNRLRQQEHLSFPLNQIPLMVTEERVAFYRSRLFWIAAGIAGSLNVLNALHSIYPSVPYIAVKRQVFVVDGLPRPWSAMSPIAYSWNPFLLGLEYFLPVDLLFSIVCFFWFARFQSVFLSYLGLDFPGADGATTVAPYMREQSFGSLVALAVFVMWAARGSWRESWRSWKTIMRPDRATVGLVFGCLVMVGVLCTAGLAPHLSALFVVIYIIVLFSLSHIRAQYGPVSAGLFLTAPSGVIYNLLGKDLIGTQGLAALAVTNGAAREFTYSPAPATLEGFALTENRVPPATLAGLIMFAALVGYTVSFGWMLDTGYRLGFESAHTSGTLRFLGREACTMFTTRLNSPVVGTHWDCVAAMGFGGVLTFVAQALRTRFLSFPLHPVAYAISGSYTASFMWSTTLIAWVLKLAVMRYGGLKGYHKAAPFFLGLILGEFVIGSIISLIGIFTGQYLYAFWPY